MPVFSLQNLGVSYCFSTERQVQSGTWFSCKNSKAGCIPVCWASGMTSRTTVADPSWDRLKRTARCQLRHKLYLGKGRYTNLLFKISQRVVLRPSFFFLGWNLLHQGTETSIQFLSASNINGYLQVDIFRNIKLEFFKLLENTLMHSWYSVPLKYYYNYIIYSNIGIIGNDKANNSRNLSNTETTWLEKAWVLKPRRSNSSGSYVNLAK